MARKKSISISRKPSVVSVDPVFAEPAPPPVEPVATQQAAAMGFANPLSWAVYHSVYCVSYSVVFSAMLLGKCIPGSGLIGRALQDGAGAAQNSFKQPPQASRAEVGMAVH